MISLEQYQLQAWLNGGWVDLTSDVYDESVTVVQGISGGQDTDLVARPGRMTFDLYNDGGKYIPGHAGALSGWNLDVKVRLILGYAGQSVTQFVGWAREIKPIFDNKEQKRVKVTAYDWFEQAARAPIEMPQIQRSKTAAQAVEAVLAKSPIQPDATSLATGSTFPTVFDTVTGQTTVYGELAKIAQSEFGTLYLRADGTLVLESENQRDSGAVLALPATNNDADFAFLLADDDPLMLADDDLLQLSSSDAVIDGTADNLDIDYGAYYANTGKVTGYPRRVDETPVVLARTPEPLLIPSGSAIVKLPYVDPTGVSRQTAGLSDAMETPSPGQTIDPTLVTLVSFNINMTDATGKRVWTQNDSAIVVGTYVDGYNIVMVSSSPPIGGGYLVLGGYSNYKVTTPAHVDFNFGNQPFTIGWWEARINVVQAVGSIAYGENDAYPPFLLNYLIPASRDMLIFISSNGTSWDIANGRSFGKINASRWRYYELCRDADGWFYAFADGKLTDKWYSPLAMRNGANPLCLGRTQNSWCYTAMSDFFVHKGKCLHTRDYMPPQSPKSIYLDEDYWGNTTKDRSGANITAITVATEYGAREVRATLTNNSGNDAYVYFQQRGKGVYFDAPLEMESRDTGLVAIDGVRELTLQQKYRTQPSFAKIAAVVARRKIKRADLKKVTFTANLSKNMMILALTCDIGALVQIKYAPANIDNYYWIQSREIKISGRQLSVAWTLQQHFGSVT